MLHWNFNSRKFLRPWNTGTYDELCAPGSWDHWRYYDRVWSLPIPGRFRSG